MVRMYLFAISYSNAKVVSGRKRSNKAMQRNIFIEEYNMEAQPECVTMCTDKVFG